jgi:hypothetical protein
MSSSSLATGAFGQAEKEQKGADDNLTQAVEWVIESDHDVLPVTLHHDPRPHLTLVMHSFFVLDLMI